jgi:hypothetical protein
LHLLLKLGTKLLFAFKTFTVWYNNVPQAVEVNSTEGKCVFMIGADAPIDFYYCSRSGHNLAKGSTLTAHLPRLFDHLGPTCCLHIVFLT